MESMTVEADSWNMGTRSKLISRNVNNTVYRKFHNKKERVFHQEGRCHDDKKHHSCVTSVVVTIICDDKHIHYLMFLFH